MIPQLTEKEQEARKRVCLPLDGLEDLHALQFMVERTAPIVGLYKIGKESFTRLGLDTLQIVKNNGADLFLDLKYHDIPNTVKGASDAASEAGSAMFNVHASGGRAMLGAARKAVDEYSKRTGNRPNLIAVTVLTSIGAAEYLDINRVLVPKLSAEDIKPYLGMKTEDIEKQADFATMLQDKGYDHLVIEDEKRGLRTNVVEQEVKNLAHIANDEGLDGIVCSAADLYAVRDSLPRNFMYVTPGIKGPRTPAGDDQNRVFTPGNAIQDGSSILVVGRAITDPRTKEQKEQKVEVTEEMIQQAGYEVLQDMAPHL